jgi:hypothetical protein
MAEDNEKETNRGKRQRKANIVPITSDFTTDQHEQFPDAIKNVNGTRNLFRFEG